MWTWMKGLPPMSKAALAAGVAALCAAAAMNIAFGSTIAATGKGQMIYSGASFVCAVAGTLVFGMMTGRLLRERRWVAAIFPALILILATLWDILTVVGFNATEQLSAAAHYTSTKQSEKDAAAERKKHADKLVGVATIRTPGISRAQRKEFLQAASAEIDKVAAGTEVKIIPAALAEMIHRRTSVPVEDIQFTMFFYMAILLILIQSTGFTMTTFCDDREVAASPPKTGTDTGGGGKKLELVKSASDARDAPDAPKKIHASAHLMQADPQQRGASVPSTGAKKMSDADLSEYLRQKANSGLSQRAKAHELRALGYVGLSQPQISRKSRRIEEQAARKAARISARRSNGHHGFGGGLHAPAIG